MRVRTTKVRCVFVAASIAAVFFAGQIQTRRRPPAPPPPIDWLGSRQHLPGDVRSRTGDREHHLVGRGPGALVLHAPQRHLARRGPGNPGYTRRRRHRRQQRQRRRQQQRRRHRPQPHRALDDRPVPRDRHPPPQPAHQRLRDLRRRGDHARGTPAERSTCSAASTPTPRPRPARPSSPATAPRSPSTRSSPSPPTRWTLCGWTGRRRAPPDRHDARRRHVGERHPDRPVRPDRRRACCTGQPRRHGTVDPRRRQCRGRDAPRPTRPRHLHVERDHERRQRHVVVHDRPDCNAAGPDDRTCPTRAPASARSTFEPVAPFRFVDTRIEPPGRPARRRRPDHGRHRRPRHHCGQRQLRQHQPDRRRLPHALQLHEPASRCQHARTSPAASSPTKPSCRCRRASCASTRRVDTDLVIDINGYFRAASATSSGFVPVTPKRLYDTRQADIASLEPGVPRVLSVEGVARWRSQPSPTPSPSTSRSSDPWTTASSGPTRAARPTPARSRRQLRTPRGPGQLGDRPDLAPAGTICVVSNAPTELLVDIAGYFVAGSGYHFTPLVPVRLFDTRSVYAELNPATGGGTLAASQIVQFTVAGTRGVPGQRQGGIGEPHRRRCRTAPAS